ncbi:hypothetical protein D1609_14370 [Leptospira borgpetersenii serovar Hardjo-bovis]|nr:hypothetical protein D1609_14370 [Leptospira borgpetersenii serovar Hardjo-bovis]TQE53091.1 hypothetical protein FFZ95_08475 [Leptospira borgpetersenii]TQE56953.1 hypothetical protein FFZ96_08230 [Leptospira borgpetersenii]
MKRFLRKRFRSRAILAMKFASDSPELSYNAFQNPGLLCQKDQAARFCPIFGTEPYIEFIRAVEKFHNSD